MKTIPNPEYVDAPYELGLYNKDGMVVTIYGHNHRFKSVPPEGVFLVSKSRNEWVVKNSIPPFIAEA